MDYLNNLYTKFTNWVKETFKKVESEVEGDKNNDGYQPGNKGDKQ